MKKIIFQTLAIITATAFFMGCEKNDGPVSVDLARAPQVQVDKVDGSDAVIDVLNPDAFKGVFTVGTYYANDIPPQKMDVVIVKNGDNAGAKVFKADLTTFPSQFEITTADLAALFGAPVELNDSYDVGGDVYTTSGQKFQAFPPGATANGGGVPTQPGANPFTRYSAVCAYNPDFYEGDFEVVVDEFGDTAPGDIIAITRIDDTHFSYIYPSCVDPLPIIVAVNPATNATSITKQKIGSKFDWAPYTNPNAATVPSVDNVVLPCDKVFSLLINYTVDQGSFGNWKLSMKKKE